MRDASATPSAATARSLVAMLVCATANCCGDVTFQAAMGWPGAAGYAKNVASPSALASSNGALVRRDTSGCGAGSTVAGEFARFICCRQDPQPEDPPLRLASPTKSVCA